MNRLLQMLRIRSAVDPRETARRAGARAAAARAVGGAVAELWLDTHARIRALRARAA